jgi:hypothetical protein
VQGFLETLALCAIKLNQGLMQRVTPQASPEELHAVGRPVWLHRQHLFHAHHVLTPSSWRPQVRLYIRGAEDELANDLVKQLAVSLSHTASWLGALLVCS